LGPTLTALPGPSERTGPGRRFLDRQGRRRPLGRV